MNVFAGEVSSVEKKVDESIQINYINIGNKTIKLFELS